MIPPEIYFAFQRIERVRPASADLAIEKARTAFVIADIMALRGGSVEPPLKKPAALLFVRGRRAF